MPTHRLHTIPTRMAAAAAALCLALSAACSGSPTGPGTLTAGRRVLTGGGGGSTSPVCTPGDICGRVEVRAAGGTMRGTSVVNATGSTAFSFEASLEGSGRLSSGYISVDVSGDTAVINALTYSRGNGTFGQEAVNATASVTVTAGGCSEGRDLVSTTITATVQNFGPTTITESHCYPLATR